jgi:hypothetical protein
LLSDQIGDIDELLRKTPLGTALPSAGSDPDAKESA